MNSAKLSQIVNCIYFWLANYYFITLSYSSFIIFFGFVFWIIFLRRMQKFSTKSFYTFNNNSICCFWSGSFLIGCYNRLKDQISFLREKLRYSMSNTKACLRLDFTFSFLWVRLNPMEHVNFLLTFDKLCKRVMWHSLHDCAILTFNE